MNKEKETQNNTFITPGIYKQISSPSYLYKIDDCIPVLVDNKPKLIGEGRFSNVYLYKNKNNDSLYALKKISINKILESGNSLSIIQREINIHSKIIHENIVQLYSVKEDINEVNILLEYCRNGSIFELISKNGFDEYTTYQYFSQVVNAIYFLHKNNLVHRDLKPENILLDGDKIKLCDFGWCCETNTNNRKSFCGTFEYMAPEIIKEMPYGKSVDIWALGILLYEFYYGVSPFNSNKEKNEQTKEIIDKILHKKLYFPDWKIISNEMKDLIIKLLEMDASKRYTIEQVIKHPWFKKFIKGVNNINFYPPIKKPKVTKITKIIKNRRNIVFDLNTKFKTDLIDNRYDDEENMTERGKIDKSSSKSVAITQLINIDINIQEDNSPSLRRQNSIKDNIKIENTYKQKYNCDTYRNNLKKVNTLPIKSGNKKITKLNNDKGTQNSIFDTKINNHYLFPMDNILEETSNENEKENLSSIPIHASVIKLKNKNKDEDNNNINSKSLNVNIINKNNPGNQILNYNYITNNYYLTNNYYTINYNNEYNDYNGEFNNNLENIGNYNNIFPYHFYNQFAKFSNNEYQ